MNEDAQVEAWEQMAWEDYVERVSFRTGTVNLINWAGGNPHFEFKLTVIDSYSGETRPLTIIEGIDRKLIYHAQPDDPRRCVVIRWFHRQFRNMFVHECDEYFQWDGERVFNPHDPHKRLPGVIY